MTVFQQQRNRMPILWDQSILLNIEVLKSNICKDSYILKNEKYMTDMMMNTLKKYCLYFLEIEFKDIFIFI